MLSLTAAMERSRRAYVQSDSKAKYSEHTSIAHRMFAHRVCIRSRLAQDGLSRAALEEAQVDDLGLQPELALVLDEALLLLRRRE